MGSSFIYDRHVPNHSVVMAMSGIEDVFNELLFGQGAFLGLIIIVSLILMVGALNKYARLVFMPITVLMAIMYLDNIADSSIFMWCAVIMFLCTVLLGWMFVEKN